MDDCRLIHGDCLEVLPTLAPGGVDVVLADPPYGLTNCLWDSVIPLEPLWAELRRVLRPHGVVALTAGQPFASALLLSNPGWYRHEWVWLKNRGSNFANTVREPMKEHEHVLVFSPGGWKYNPQMQERSPAGAGRARYPQRSTRCGSPVYREMPRTRLEFSERRVPSSWQRFNCEVGLHPTQKPVALMEYLVRTYTDEGDVVLDFCMGSGTTGLACLTTGRRFVGIEREAAYVEIARKRLAEARGPLFAR
jgi:site-specific DNA-methyltransferase (adenine-specific)